MDRKEFLGTIGKGVAGIAGGATMLSACSGLLDQTNPNTLSPKNYWETAKEAKAGVTSVYGALRRDPYDHWHNFLVLALYRGDDIGITHDVPVWWSLAQWNLTAASTPTDELAPWQHYYQIVYRANQVVNNVPSINMDKSLKERFIGEAKFLRAYSYFWLVNNYLNVPLILETPQASEHYSVAQAPPDKTWGQVEKDLEDAARVLPVTYDDANKGRITKGAALSFLGKTCLFQQKWSKAVQVLEQVITSKNYELLPNFQEVFSPTNEFNHECLFEVVFNSQAKKGHDIYSPRNREESIPEAGGWYECYPNKWLFEQMTKEKTKSGKLDPRIYSTILWNGSGKKYYGQSYDDLVGGDGTKMGWMKYSGAELNHTINDFSGKNTRVLRFSDVLLMHAEAVLQSGGTPHDARKSINRVRHRANLKKLPSTMTDKLDLLREIEHQRVVELADEGIRWFDLLRWDGSIDGSMTIKQNLVQHGALAGANFETYKKYLPIPLGEINTNKKVKQNPGY